MMSALRITQIIVTVRHVSARWLALSSVLIEHIKPYGQFTLDRSMGEGGGESVKSKERLLKSNI